MALVDEALRAFIATQKLSYAATVNPDGTPNLSPKGSIEAWDDRHVIFADIASPATARNLRANPAIEINVLDPFSRRGYRIRGRGTVKDAGPELEAVKGALTRRFGDLYPVNGVVVVEVTAVRAVVSPSYMFDPKAEEGAIRSEWMGIYKVRPVEAD